MYFSFERVRWERAGGNTRLSKTEHTRGKLHTLKGGIKRGKRHTGKRHTLQGGRFNRGNGHQ